MDVGFGNGYLEKNFPTEMFDAVTSVNTIYFWSDTVKGLTEINRVLKDRGIFVSAVYSQEWLKKLSYTKKVLISFQKKITFQMVKKQDFPK